MPNCIRPPGRSARIRVREASSLPASSLPASPSGAWSKSTSPLPVWSQSASWQSTSSPPVSSLSTWSQSTSSQSTSSQSASGRWPASRRSTSLGSASQGLATRRVSLDPERLQPADQAAGRHPVRRRVWRARRRRGPRTRRWRPRDQLRRSPPHGRGRQRAPPFERPRDRRPCRREGEGFCGAWPRHPRCCRPCACGSAAG